MTELKRLYFDVETSPNTGYFWEAGYKIRIPYENIIKERAIICICYKWEGNDKVYRFKWKDGDDKQILLDFLPIIESATEVVAHNGDNFDVKWFRTRCLFHGIPVIPDIKTIDTLQISKSKFRFNSNRLDYIAQFLGLGCKIKTEYQLWKDIMRGDKKALAEMVRYCQHDVVLLEKIYKKIESYAPVKTHAGVLAGGLRIDCPACASTNTRSKGLVCTAAGTKQQRRGCRECGRNFRISLSAAERDEKLRERSTEL